MEQEPADVPNTERTRHTVQRLSSMRRHFNTDAKLIARKELV
jgi:hypothetical protein